MEGVKNWQNLADVFSRWPLMIFAISIVGNDRTRNFLPNRTFVHMNYDLRSYQLKLIKMLAELANLNHCAVPFLSRAAVNLSLYNSNPVIK